MTTIEKYTRLDSLTLTVSYEGKTHKTTYQGAHELLNNILEGAGIYRDAKSAVLRAFENKCLTDNWHFDFEAGLITISK